MYPIRVKIPELEGRNYEAYTIYTGIFDGKTRKVELNKNTNITGQGYMIFRTKKEDNDVEVYQFSKNRQLTPLYHRYQLNERGRSEGDFGLYAEVYQTYVFLFKNHTEKPAEKPAQKPAKKSEFSNVISNATNWLVTGFFAVVSWVTSVFKKFF